MSHVRKFISEADSHRYEFAIIPRYALENFETFQKNERHCGFAAPVSLGEFRAMGGSPVIDWYPHRKTVRDIWNNSLLTYNSDTSRALFRKANVRVMIIWSFNATGSITIRDLKETR